MRETSRLACNAALVGLSLLAPSATSAQPPEVSTSVGPEPLLAAPEIRRESTRRDLLERDWTEHTWINIAPVLDSPQPRSGPWRTRTQLFALMRDRDVDEGFHIEYPRPEPPEVVHEDPDVCAGESHADPARLQYMGPLLRLLAPNGAEGVAAPRFSGECSGTIVTFEGNTGILTAAHCLFRLLQGGNVLGEPVPAFALSHGSSDKIDGVLSRETVRSARVSPEFVQCARGSSGIAARHIKDCVRTGWTDAAFIPVPGLQAMRPWRVASGTASDTHFRAFGYGLVNSARVDYLQSARFDPIDSTTAEGICGNVPDPGNSGGSLISHSDDTLLTTSPPAVTHVVSSRYSVAGRPIAVIQPIAGRLVGLVTMRSLFPR